MEASRLVFVSVRNAKPRRKVAIPIPNGATWEQFCQQIQTKLKLRGVQRLELATSGEHITNLDELQDIDELYVEEAAVSPPKPPANGHGNDRITTGSTATSSASFSPASPDAGPTSRSQKASAPASDASTSPLNIESEQKYAKRSGGVKRSLQKVLPNFFSPTLPVTTRNYGCRDIQDDGKGGRSRRRRRSRSLFSLRNIMRFIALLVFILFLLFLYSIMVPRME